MAIGQPFRHFYPGDIDSVILPGYKLAETIGMTPMTPAGHFTAFIGHRRLASGPLADVALTIKKTTKPAGHAPILIFDDRNGRSVDIDLRGTDAEVLARLPLPAMVPATPADEEPAEPRGRGRPRLGVVAREVTLLPRHWDWLASQPGGASVALRKLVEEARRANGDRDRHRAARDAAYHFMSAMAGNFKSFEEASRALFADDRRRFGELIATWPDDIRDHIVGLAFSDRDPT
jgi:hypothetical protein